MRICVLQSAYPADVNREHDPGYHPEFYVPMHSFEHRWIHKKTAQVQLDAALEEQFDVYFNLMWGQYEDDVAGIEAVLYLESKLPSFMGVPSQALLKSKRDFYEAARERQRPCVPHNDLSRFPLFVKPVNGCGSQGIDQASLCYTPEQLEDKLQALDKVLAPARNRRPLSLCRDDVSCKPSQGGCQSIPADILVTEFIRGADYSLIVCRVGDLFMSLCPQRWRLSTATGPEKNPELFLSQGVKYDEKTSVQLVDRDSERDLYNALQTAGLQAWIAADNGADWGHVDIRVRDSGDVVALEVNPMPAIFIPPTGHEWDDPAVKAYFPGGHRSLVNSAIATHRLRLSSRADGSVDSENDRRSQVSASYDQFSEKYDATASTQTATLPIIQQYVAQCDFTGSVLDLGCGTGAFGIALQSKKDYLRGRVTGVELSPGMAARARSSGAYTSILEGSIQNYVSRIEEPVDHIVSFYALQFLDPVDMDFVLVSAFLTASCSVTISVDEIPEAYNDALRQNGYAHMAQWDHVQTVETFGVPRGWRLISQERFFAWKSWHTGHEVYTTVFRFERHRSGDVLTARDIRR